MTYLLHLMSEGGSPTVASGEGPFPPVLGLGQGELLFNLRHTRTDGARRGRGPVHGDILEAIDRWEGSTSDGTSPRRAQGLAEGPTTPGSWTSSSAAPVQ